MVSKVVISRAEDMSWQFSYRHLVRGFLKLEDFLIHELTLLVGDHIGIQGTLLTRSIAGLLYMAIVLGQRQTREPTLYLNIFAVITALALNVDDCCF